MLICTKEIANIEIKSFIERALRDYNNQYVLLGFQNLSRQKQQFIIDQITQFRKGRDAEGEFTLKLCLVGNSEIDMLYKFARESLGKPGEKVAESVQEAKIAYKKKLSEKTEMVKIVSSQRAGLGKSTFIKKENKNIYHLPLSGQMLVPVDGSSD